MKLMKGEAAINEAFNAWLEKYGFSARVSGMGLDFSWDCVDDTVEYSLLYSEKHTAIWNEFLAELGLEGQFDPFWTSFFHELAHSETWDLLDDDEFGVPEDVTPYEYFRLPRERVATAWAVDYMNHHHQGIEDLYDMVCGPMEKFFELNQIQI